MVFYLFMYLFFLGAIEPFAAGLDESFYIANGPVHDMAADETTLYIAGDFTHLGSITGSGAVLDPLTGIRIGGSPEFSGGRVASVISDGQQPSGWYVGGSFTHVDGEEQSAIAHILPDKTLDTAFDPFAELGIRGGVYTMVLDDGILYVGGSFYSSVDTEFSGLAGIDTSTAEVVMPWLPKPRPGSTIYEMVLSGSTLYVSGNFDSIGGQNRAGLAAVETLGSNSASTGAADAQWDPDPGADTVFALAASGTYLYAGGTFSSIGGQDRSRIAALETVGMGDGTGRAHASWDPDVYVDPNAEIDTDCNDVADDDDDGICEPNEYVNALLLSGNILYASGAFGAIGGLARSNIAALDIVGLGDGTGQADALWDPGVQPRPALYSQSAMAIDETDDRLFLGGGFTEVGGVSRPYAAVVAAAGAGDGTGAVVPDWRPNPNRAVSAMYLSEDGSLLYIGGSFTGLFDVQRSRIAAIDKATGVPTGWDPDADGPVRSLVLSGTTLYAAGQFAAIGGQPRNRIAALDTSVNTANATGWNPDADGEVLDLLLNEGTVYVSGRFMHIGGKARSRIAALDASTDTGNATDWDPNADGPVYAMLLADGTLYAGGSFTQIGGAARNRLAALDTSVDSNNATAWNPNVWFFEDEPCVVKALAIDGTTLYFGGAFDRVGEKARSRIAAVDTETDTDNATPWNPDFDGDVNALYLHGTHLYAVGSFLASFHSYHTGFAVLDITRDDRPVRSWHPRFASSSDALELFSVLREELTLYAGGSFDSVWSIGAKRDGIVRFSLTPPTIEVDLPEGTYPKPQFASVGCEPATGFACDTAHFTFDGSDPTPRSQWMQAGGIYIGETGTLKLMVVDNAGAESSILVRSYAIEPENVICFIDVVSNGSSGTNALGAVQDVRVSR